MEVTKDLNQNNIYDISIKNNKMTIELSFAGNGDLYIFFIQDDITRLQQCENYEFDFPVFEDDGPIYYLINDLYNNLIQKDEYNDTIDKKITFISDDTPLESGDRITIEKDDNCYSLIFNRTEFPYCGCRKNAHSIVIRLCTSGSRNREFVNEFIRFYQGLKNINNYQRSKR